LESSIVERAYMSTVEREAQREDLRERIVEAARDIVGEEGLDALSMRALGVRIGYSPATIYLHFRDKDELLRSVMEEGFKRLGAVVREEMSVLESEPSALDRLAATARGYARFALESTGYFHAMFKIPGVARLEGCPVAESGTTGALGAPLTAGDAADLLRQARTAGEAGIPDPDRAALMGWGLMHGLTSLYLSGHLADHVASHEEFMELIESAIEGLRAGWKV
jgi:AcrR family transcriptional regulator